MLVTVAEFKDSIYWDSNRNWTDGQVTQALSYAEDRFYQRTRRKKYGYWLEPVTDQVTLHGTGLPVIRCYYPILALSSVLCDDVEIVDDIRIDHSHFLYRATVGEYFGTLPDSILETVYANVILTGQFGDPETSKGTPLVSTIPWDVKVCVMRMASFQLLKERQQLDRTRDRAGNVHTHYIDVTNDPIIADTIMNWTVHDMSGISDFR